QRGVTTVLPVAVFKGPRYVQFIGQPERRLQRNALDEHEADKDLLGRADVLLRRRAQYELSSRDPVIRGAERRAVEVALRQLRVAAPDRADPRVHARTAAKGPVGDGGD